MLLVMKVGHQNLNLIEKKLKQLGAHLVIVNAVPTMERRDEPSEKCEKKEAEEAFAAPLNNTCN